MRRRLDPLVQTGTVRCVGCDELIDPGSPWQLDHRDNGRGWLGPSHASCNARAGWEKMVASANGHGLVPEEKPYKWSQRWSEDPPPGTAVSLHNGFVEIYLGSGTGRSSR